MNFNCECLPVLIDNGYLTTATSIDFETGKSTPQVVLGKLKEGKNGRLSVEPKWYLVQFCPNCGKPLIPQTPDSE